MSTMWYMARRKSPDLTIRLTATERARLDRAAEVRHERGVSTWARKVLLENAGGSPEEGVRILHEIQEYARTHPEEMKARWEEIERMRREGWSRDPR